MNYQRCYEAIVSQTRARYVTDAGSVTDRIEWHHVVPFSLGGTDDPANLVPVTPREHFILHLLLVKMHTGQARAKMAAALVLMIRNTNKRLGRGHVTNRRYDASRFWQTAKFSEEHRRKISEAAKKRDPATRKQTVEANEKRAAALRGKQKSREAVEKMAAAQRGKTRGSWGSHSDETKAKISVLHSGKPKSDEHRLKIGEAQVGKKRPAWTPERRAKFAATISARSDRSPSV